MGLPAPAPPPPSAPPDTPLRLMLVDDSLVARSVVQRILAPHPEFAVVAVASSADQALARVGDCAPDIILLDLQMPGTDGLTALPALLARAAGARVLVVSSGCERGGDAAVRALTLGAADTLAKPAAGRFGGAFEAELLGTLRRIGARPGGSASDRPAAVAPVPQPVVPLRPAVHGPVGCIAVGASTGGLVALTALFRGLPPALRVPILITQHLPAAFMPFFAAQIRDIAGRRAKVAEDGDRLAPDLMLIAPGDGHIGLCRTGETVRVQLQRGTAASGCLPSVDPMFDALAAQFGAAGVGVVLSGMGRDGAVAARRLVDAGGEVLVQDMASSVVWGMPGAVAAGGSAAAVLDAESIGRRIARRVAMAEAAAGAPRAWR